MNWKSMREEKPLNNGLYVISVTLITEHKEGVLINSVAYYDAVQDKWFKHDPYDYKRVPSTQEEITEKVNAWIQDLGCNAG